MHDTSLKMYQGAKRDEVNISNSDELQQLLQSRNTMQQEDSNLFEESGQKKRKFIPAEDDLPVEDSYVTIRMDGADGLIVKKAKKPGHDLTIPLVSEQLKILFDYLTQEGTSCLGKSTRTYQKSGKYAKSLSVHPED